MEGSDGGGDVIGRSLGGYGRFFNKGSDSSGFRALDPRHHK